jgi:hypothetical protein
LLAEGLSPSEAVQRIITTARPVSCGLGCHGLVDAAAAVGPPPPPVVVAGASSAQRVPAMTQPPRPTSTQASTPTTATAAPTPATSEQRVALASGGADGEVSAVVASTRVTGWGPYARPIAAWSFVAIVLTSIAWGKNRHRGVP